MLASLVSPKNPWDVSRGVKLTPVLKPQGVTIGGSTGVSIVSGGDGFLGRGH